MLKFCCNISDKNIKTKTNTPIKPQENANKLQLAQFQGYQMMNIFSTMTLLMIQNGQLSLLPYELNAEKQLLSREMIETASGLAPLALVMPLLSDLKEQLKQSNGE